MAKKRADEMVLEQGLAEDLREARALLLSGVVFSGRRRVDKPGALVDESARLRLEKSARRYVSRGGEKLEGALKQLGLDVRGKACLDLGASTGGFTDCLLRRGARRVYAVDVGKGQLDWSLRRDPRVRVREGVNARHLRAGDIGEEIDWVVADLSFISLRLVLPALKRFAPARFLLLVKPQFEALREEVSRGGVVDDESLRQDILDRLEQACREEGFQVAGRADSAVKGRVSGNLETFLLLDPPP